MVFGVIRDIVIRLIAEYAQQLMKFVIPQILFLVLIEKSGHQFRFRFSDIGEDSRLKPYVSIWSLGAVAFIVYLFTPILFELVSRKTIHSWLTSLDLLSLLLLTISLSGFTLMFIVEYLLEKTFDKNTVIFGAITAFSFLLFLVRIV